MKKYKTAVGYLRISSESQKDGSSIEEQKLSIKSFCTNQGIVLLELYVDTFSGKTFNRPEFENSFKYLKDNRNDVDLFLTKKADRFTRGLKTGLEAFDEISELGIEVNFVDEWIENIQSPQGQMLMHLKFTFAEYERACIYERTRAGERRALQSGRYTKTPPLGYSRGTISRGEFIGKKGMVPNEKAPLVKELFEDYSTGLYNQRELLTKFRAKGLKTSKSAISVILSNPLYAGIIDLKRYETSPFTQIKGCHQPIITEDLFLKVQRIKQGKNKNKKKIRGKNPLFPLNTFLYCSSCGSPMRGSTSNNGKKRNKTTWYNYYRCANNCGESYTPEEIHSKFLSALASIKPSAEVIELFRHILIDNYKTNSRNRIKMLSNINKQIEEVEKLQLSLTDKFARDLLSNEIYQKAITATEYDINKLKTEREQLGDYQDGLDKYVRFGLNIFVSLDYYYKNASIEVKTKLLSSYFNDKLYFDKNKFRTLPFVNIINLICNKNKGFQQLNKKKGANKNINSLVVARTGLEPATFGL
ncbi:recombinase family protein [Nonlabens dokdonensis]|uniref:Site-specific recombinase n=1 Tax=Nonlabens dokdonensis (strain DSM 17205 / KCTC 12402 / DSW-6) TaxID=592029 RepID=L7W389_NONDD|nr:site-specific recombinase [Nonlabens dokdonensis DSW-6]